MTDFTKWMPWSRKNWFKTIECSNMLKFIGRKTRRFSKVQQWEPGIIPVDYPTMRHGEGWVRVDDYHKLLREYQYAQAKLFRASEHIKYLKREILHDYR